jgi:hypothetical protein
LEASNVNNLTKVSVGSLFTYNGLSEFDSASKLVCFGVDGGDNLLRFKDYCNCGIERKSCTFNVRCAFCYTSNQFGCVNVTSINLVAKIELML